MASRPLNVIGEFKPFGLVAEALDGKLAEAVSQKYDYYLFDPRVTREQDDVWFSGTSALESCDRGDHELFIRGNRLIWSANSRVQRRYSSRAQIIMARWCRMNAISEPLLCVLQINTLTVYNISGEVICIPVADGITSIWPLPFGLLLQRTAERTSPHNHHFFSMTSHPSAQDLPRSIGEHKSAFHYHADVFSAVGHNVTADMSTLSHMVLKHPLEDPQPIFAENKGRVTAMSDFCEMVLWTSDVVPLVASYNKGKILHSVWLVACTSERTKMKVGADQCYIQKIWEGNSSSSAAHKVFLATDDDGVPIICFLLQEKKALLSVRLQMDEQGNTILCDVKSHIVWSIPAMAAAPITVTRPRTNYGLLPFMDIIVLDIENMLLLYTGKKCLCKFYLPLGMPKGSISNVSEHSASEISSSDIKILDLADAVCDRINVIVSNGKIYRCTLRPNLFCLLTNDCITAMAEGMHPSLYNHFVTLLWGDSDGGYPSKRVDVVDSEWHSFSNIIMKLCRGDFLSCEANFNSPFESAWEFLIKSKFHTKYSKHLSLPLLSFALPPAGSTSPFPEPQGSGKSKEDLLTDHLLSDILDSLHALYESLKLDNLRMRDAGLLVNVLCNVAASLGESSYVDHYLRDFPRISKKFVDFCFSLHPRSPPSLLRWLESCLLCGSCSTNHNDIPLLIQKDGSSVVSWARKIVSFYSILFGSERNGRKLSTGVYVNMAAGSTSSNEELAVLAMVGERFGLPQLDLLPHGVSLPLRHALDKCRELPPTDWPAAAYVLIGREDLAVRCLAHASKLPKNGQLSSTNLMSLCAPYMVHMYPVTVHSEVPESEDVNVVDTDSTDGFVVDGMEHMFNSSMQLRFGRDLRLTEVRCLLCSARPVSLRTSSSPSASDQELQQAHLWQLSQRTMALPFGRGAFTLATICTLLTEPFVFPKLVLAGRLPSQQNATVNLDPNTRNISELICWPEFHNGVAAGMKLAPVKGKVSRTWITYNKPEQLNATHAGLLLALGLHGHLRVLSIADVYQYLSPEHDTTIVGVLLGMAASYRGTMQPAVSKMLYLHLPSRHPSSFPELELPTLVQCAALLAVGLLYEGSTHPLSLKILLSELGSRSCGDNVLEREGYAVAAGFSLGLVTLGQGKEAFGFKDIIVEHLFQYIGGKDMQDVTNGAMINVDVTAPGATLALALMFLKTECEEVASRIYLPQTLFSLQCVRPDFIMLRVIAQNMILWSRIFPSNDWIDSQIPEIVRLGIMQLKDETVEHDRTDFVAICQSYIYLLTGACISLGLRYAGTRNVDAEELLYSHAIFILNEIRASSGMSEKVSSRILEQYVDRSTLETCLHLVVLSLSVVMAGSGQLRLFRLLRYLRKRNLTEAHTNFGIQMTVSLAIGFLFLGGGTHSFSRRSGAIAALLISLYPRLPAGANDNRCHLQAFRHMYVLATESRLVQTVDVDTGLPVYAPLEVTIRETENHSETSFFEISPSILPERAVLKSVRVCGPRYWPQIIEIDAEDQPWWRFGDICDPFNGGTLHVKRKVGTCSYVDDPSGCQSLLSRGIHKVHNVTVYDHPVESRCFTNVLASQKLDQLIHTFTSNPSLVAFGHFLSVCSQKRTKDEFREFSLQVLFECVSRDMPAFLKIYISLYETIDSMAEQVAGSIPVCDNSLFLYSLKIAVAYNEAVVVGRFGRNIGSIVRSVFIDALKRRFEDVLIRCQAESHVQDYVSRGTWPTNAAGSGHLSWYLQWYGIPPPFVLKLAIKNIKTRASGVSCVLPLLHLILPSTGAHSLITMDKFLMSLGSELLVFNE